MLLQILPHGASKGAGVARMLKNVGASADGLMALGDGENDVQMFEVSLSFSFTHHLDASHMPHVCVILLNVSVGAGMKCVIDTNPGRACDVVRFKACETTALDLMGMLLWLTGLAALFATWATCV